MIDSLINHQTLLDQDVDLTGHMLWPASAYLTEFILSRKDLFRGLNAIELGSGTGLCGLWAAKFCKKMTLTDCEDSVTDLLRFNVNNNIFQLEKPTVANLMWGENSEKNFLESYGPIDIIIGSDLVYPESEWNIPPLFSTVKNLLQLSTSTSTSTFILSYVERSPSTTLKLKEVIRENSLKFTLVPKESFTKEAHPLLPQIFLIQISS
eukprot:TRINITY_DN1319_c0_g4_i2.p1 TRINITY_DN1319_c0_g4~~TRINITY_DN1319_c0_g4_i2.p1  ORF type:complete len:208 (-),score=77.53 TRINITY_DN1319_c0_g4_i2:15-638(-)